LPSRHGGEQLRSGAGELRRTCATHFQKHGKPRDIQAQLRHTKSEMTGPYIKEIPEAVRAAVESMDRELCQVTEELGPVQ
jgi:hypothetical protein